MVVVHHARNEAEHLWNPWEAYDGFAWGVDIFFVISGFIMVVAASGDRPGRFLLKRGIRIIPLYWVATLVLLIVSRRKAIFSTPWDQWGDVMLSLLFIPHYSASNPGQVFPYLVPGWTLNYEVFFYAIFAIGLAFRRPVLVSTVCIVTLCVLGAVLHPPGPILQTYTSPQLLEFLAGAWIGQLYRKGFWSSPWLGLLVPIGFVGLMVSNPWTTDEVWRWPWMISASAAIVAGVVALDRWTPYLRFPALLGDASYSIYLTHVLAALSVASWMSARVADVWLGPAQFALHLTIAVAVSIAIGLLFYSLVERPSLRWLRAKLLVRSTDAERVRQAG